MQGADGPVNTQGLSQAELEQIASEIGIDPRYVAAAVARLQEREYDQDEEDTDFYLLGLPPSFEIERHVEGTVSDEAWDKVLSSIRKTFKKPAKINDWGQSKEWSFDGFTERASVTLEQRKGWTKIRMTWQDPLSRLIYCNLGFSFLILAVGISGLGLSPLFAFGLFLPVFAALFFLLRWAMTSMVSTQRRKMKRLMSELEQTILRSRLDQEEASVSTAVRPALEESSALMLEADKLEQEREEILDPIRRKTSTR